MLKTKALPALGALAVILFASSCTLSRPVQEARVEIAFAPRDPSSDGLWSRLSRSLSRSPVRTETEWLTLPDSWQGFDCLGLHVSGSGISAETSALPSRSTCTGGTVSLVEPGLIGGLISTATGGSISLAIPLGGARKVQLFGLKTRDGSCPVASSLFGNLGERTSGATHLDGAGDAAAGDWPMLLAETTVELTQDTTISLTPEFTRSAPEPVFCDGTGTAVAHEFEISSVLVNGVSLADLVADPDLVAQMDTETAIFQWTGILSLDRRLALGWDESTRASVAAMGGSFSISESGGYSWQISSTMSLEQALQNTASTARVRARTPANSSITRDLYGRTVQLAEIDMSAALERFFEAAGAETEISYESSDTLYGLPEIGGFNLYVDNTKWLDGTSPIYMNGACGTEIATLKLILWDGSLQRVHYPPCPSAPNYIDYPANTYYLSGSGLNLGPIDFTLQGMDNSGNLISSTTETMIYTGPGASDTSAPVSPSIDIQYSRGVTHFENVTLTLSADDNGNSPPFMCISENSTCSSCSYEAFSATKDHTWSNITDGTKTLSVKFKDAAGNESACASDTITFQRLVVDPRYSVAPEWMDYVSAADTSRACDPSLPADLGYSGIACLHGGEARKITTSEPTCSGLLLEDDLAAFEWTCDDTSGSAIFYSSLASGTRLSDLIQLSGTPAWKQLSVTLSSASNEGTSAATSWWNNSITVPGNSTSTSTSLSASSTIYIIDATISTAGYTIASDKVGLVIDPSKTLSWQNGAPSNSSAGEAVIVLGSSKSFSWIEGDLDCGNVADSGIHFEGSNAYIHIRNSSVTDCVVDGISADSATISGLLLHGVSSTSNNGSGLNLAGSHHYIVESGSTFNFNSSHGINLNGSSDGFIDATQASYNSQAGLDCSSSTCSDLRLTYITTSNNAYSGSYLRVDGLEVVEINADSNGGSGAFIINQGSSAVELRDLTLTANNDAGLRLDSGQYVLSQITSKGNAYGAGIDMVDSVVFGAFILTAANGNDGIFCYDVSGVGARFILSGVTSVSNLGDGLTACDNSILNNAVIASNYHLTNGSSGLKVTTISRMVASQLAIANQTVGILSGAASDFQLRGNLALGNNPTQSCSNGGYPDTFPGFTAGSSCPAASASSIDSLLTDTLVINTVFNNLSDYSLDVDDSQIRQKTGGPTTGGFTIGATCPSAAGGSENISVGPYCRDATSLDPAYTTQAACTGAGKTWVNISQQTYLKSAIEILSDSLGDDDGLCESNEHCLYAPNFGYYQGHGNIGSCTFTSGAVSGVTLWGFVTNGY